MSNGERTKRAAMTVRQLVEHSRAENTRRAYASDLAHFKRWGGTIPCSPRTLARYMASCAATYKPSTIRRRIAAIAAAHTTSGKHSPSKSPIVLLTWKGIVRSCASTPKRAAPISTAHLRKIGRAMKNSSEAEPIKRRDWCLFTLGFAGAFRRSELAALWLSSISFIRTGAVIQLGNTKTDTAQAQVVVSIPRTKSDLCPVAALRKWLAVRGSADGPLFTRILGQMPNVRTGINGDLVSARLKFWLREAGIAYENFSAHSLRAGLVTAAALAGVPQWKIKQQSRHKTTAALEIYIRDGDHWRGNAATAVMTN